MAEHTCQTCDAVFKGRAHYERHLQRKRPCKKSTAVVRAEIATIKKLEVGLVWTRTYDEVKHHVDSVLNKDKSTFSSSNDEPTPIGCIEEMMAVIPEEFWKTSKKCLDPCCGNGNFHVVIADAMSKYQASSSVLTSLHFNDLNTARLQNVVEMFGTASMRTNRDFLKDEFDTDYDLVVMNPPYARIMEDGVRASKNHGLSISFMQKGLDSLKVGGYLVAIVPDNWMSLADRNTFCSSLTQYQFIALNIHVAKKWFPKVGSSFSWFVIQKSPAVHAFNVTYMLKNEVCTDIVQSVPRTYIPLWYSATIQSIFMKTVDNPVLEKYTVETSSDLHKYTKSSLINGTELTTHPHRLIHTPKQTVWSSRPHKYQDGWKVFISTTDKYSVFVDSCGMTQSIAFIRVPDKEHAEQVRDALLHPLYRFLNNACRYGNFNNIRVLQRFPVAIDDPYKKFGITDEEVKCIAYHSR